MKLSTKIYLIVLILVVLAVGIMGLGIYSMVTLTGLMNDTNGASNRYVALTEMDRSLLRRIIAMKDIIIENRIPEMQKLIDKDFKDSVDGMEKAIEEYAALIPPDAPEEIKGRPAKLRAQWADFVKITNAAAALSLENTSNEATALNTAMTPLWDGIDADLNTLVLALRSEDSQEMGDLGDRVAECKEQLFRFRLLTADLIEESDPAALDKIAAEQKNMRLGIDKWLAEVKAKAPTAIAGQAESLARKLQEKAWPGYEKIVPLAMTDSNARASAMYNTDGMKAQIAFDTYSNELMDSALKQQDEYESIAGATSKAVILAMIVASAIGVVIGVIVAVLTIRAMNRTLSRIITNLGESSEQVYSAAGQISGASQNLAEGATEQAASLEETSSALEQMASMTRQNADNTTKTNETNKHNNKLIGEGAEAVRNMSTAMGEINDSAEKISRIIKTIEDIAFQTNLLALNAAVEAARAGEAGKGFAVVADEVRNLAQRSAQAARDTTELIEGTVTRVKNGSDIATELEKSFKEIEEGSTEVSRLIAEITAATNEQAQGVDQVNTAVAQMDKVTQQNAANAEETASASEELSAQAASLNDIVGDLVIIVDGKGSALEKQGGATRPAMAKRGGNGDGKIAHSKPVARLTGPAPTRGSGKVVMKPSDMIPLDEEDFSGF